MQESYLPPKERLPAIKTKSEMVLSLLGDAVFLALVIWIFFTSPGWLKVLYVTSFTCVAAVRIWRYRKYLASHWRKLISH